MTQPSPPGATATAKPHVALRAEAITKRFFGSPVLDGVDLQLRCGEVHGLLGENGSGKSTFIKVLSGVYQADDGLVGVGGGQATRPVQATRMTPSLARSLGIHVVHQDTPMFGSLTVAENLVLGHRYPTTRTGRVDWAGMRRRAAVVLDRYDVPARPWDLTAELSPPVRAMVAIARALQDCEGTSDAVLLLDEPTAGLASQEIDLLCSAVRRYAGLGQAILLVSHQLEEIIGVCDRVTVLRAGSVVGVRNRSQFDRSELIELIAGAVISEPARGATADDDVLRAERPAAIQLDGVCTDRLRDVSLSVRVGEVVALVGTLGAGCDDVLNVAFGLAKPTAGRINFLGRQCRRVKTADAAASGAVFVPADRLLEGIFAPLTVQENLSIPVARQYFRRGRMDRRHMRRDAVVEIRRYGVAPTDPKRPVAFLSGGNQQKVVMARSLRRIPRLLFLCEPTQGVDVSARAVLHDVILNAAASGAAVLMASTDIDEVLTLADRIVVLAAGRVVATHWTNAIDKRQLIMDMHQMANTHAELTKAAR